MGNEKFQDLVLKQLNMLTTEFKDVKSTVTKLEVDMKDVKSTVTKLEVDMKDVKSTVTKLEVDMENKVVEKIGALFDFRNVQNNVNDRVLAALERIEAKIESHDVQIHILDKTKANKQRSK